MFKFLSSIPVAIFLIASIAGMSVVATMVSDTSVYTSIPFLALVAAFALNLTLCTIGMLPKLAATWKRRAQSLDGDTAGYALYRSQAGGQALAELQGVLEAGRYRIDQVTENGRTKLLAQKGKLSLPAPHLLHIAILVVIAGSVLTSFSKSGGVMALIGQSSPMTMQVRQMIGDGSAEKLAIGDKGDDYIHVRDFQTLYDDTGAVDNWVTRFDLVIDNVQVATDVETRVNVPYQYQNILIYQNSYGYRYAVEIKGGADEGGYSLPEGQHFALKNGRRGFMLTDLGHGRTLLKVFDTSQGIENETVIVGKVVDIGDIVEIEPGVTIEYLALNPYTVLEVKVSYGTPVVFAGFILAVIASMLFWSGRYREIRVISGERADEVYVRVICKNKMIVDKINQTLAEKLIKEAK